MNPTDAENAVAAFLRFREEVNHAGLQMTSGDILQLMIAERLNMIGTYLDGASDQVTEQLLNLTCIIRERC
jgi:hypothetical protein